MKPHVDSASVQRGAEISKRLMETAARYGIAHGPGAVLSAEEAGTVLGISRTTVGERCKLPADHPRRLVGHREGRLWRIYWGDLVDYRVRQVQDADSMASSSSRAAHGGHVL